ncbi:hypothetical protein [Streptomyces sp. NPDC000994]
MPGTGPHAPRRASTPGRDVDAGPGPKGGSYSLALADLREVLAAFGFLALRLTRLANRLGGPLHPPTRRGPRRIHGTPGRTLRDSRRRPSGHGNLVARERAAFRGLWPGMCEGFEGKNSPR